MKTPILILGCILVLLACQETPESQVQASQSSVAEKSRSPEDSIVGKYPGRIYISSVANDSLINMKGELDTACISLGEEMRLRFVADKREDGRIFINDSLGNTYKTLLAGRVKPGMNEFIFSSEPLPYGNWELYVTFNQYEDTIQHVHFAKTAP